MNPDKYFLSAIYAPLKLTKRPFKSIANQLEISEKELIKLIKEYKNEGIIRRFGAVLNHRRIGFKVNALVCWKTGKKRINAIFDIINRFPQVSHCYLRATYSSWPYNLYTMVHAGSKKEIFRIIQKIASEIKVKEYKALFTLKEYKKTRPALFSKDSIPPLKQKNFTPKYKI